MTKISRPTAQAKNKRQNSQISGLQKEVGHAAAGMEAVRALPAVPSDSANV